MKFWIAAAEISLKADSLVVNVLVSDGRICLR